MRWSCYRNLLCCLFFIFLSSTAWAESTKTAVADAYLAWCKAIGSARGNPTVIEKFYAPNASLLPTLSSKILLNGQPGFDDYFIHLTHLKNIRCIPDSLVTDMHEGVAINLGEYTFSYTDDDKVRNIHARFTFIYKETDGRWLIIHHHSSQLP
jgi:uncharacterized protein (TIGR02246 family)